MVRMLVLTEVAIRARKFVSPRNLDFQLTLLLCFRLASGWGSGAVEFPYLVAPIAALREAFEEDAVSLSTFPTNSIPSQDALSDQDLCLTFINADAGEGYMTHDGINGDRNDLFAQKGGDKLARFVGENCGGGKGKTVIVVHSVGPVVVENWIDTPTVKGLLFANLPGQESGNALVSIVALLNL